MAYNNNDQVRHIETKFSYSFPNTDLLEISMVKNNDPEIKRYEKQYFYFLSMVPGVKLDGGGRNYDTKNRVTIKQDVDKMLSIAYAIRDMANAMVSKYGTNGVYTIFSDPSKTNFGGNTGNKKIFNVGFHNDSKNPGVSIGLVYGNIKCSCLFPIPVANAIADIIEFMCKKGLELEFDRSSSFEGTMNTDRRPNTYNRTNNNNNNNNNNYNRQTPNQNNQGFNSGYNSNPDPNPNSNNQNSANIFGNNIQSDPGADFAEDFRSGFGAAINSGSENGNIF